MKGTNCACSVSPEGREAYVSAGPKKVFLVVMETHIEQRGKRCSRTVTWVIL